MHQIKTNCLLRLLECGLSAHFFFCALYDVPDLRQELRQLLVGHQLEVEALTRVVVAQRPQVGQDGQELGQGHHRLTPPIDLHVGLEKIKKHLVKNGLES